MSTAHRFGGPRSRGGSVAQPTAASGWRGRAASSVSLRALGLFLFPTPLLLAALFQIARGDAESFAATAFGYVLLIFGAGLTRTGLAAEAAYEARAVAKPPAFPRKMFGSAFTALGVGAVCALRFGPVAGVVFGVAAGVLHLAAFGLDPMRAKGVDGLTGDALDAAVTRLDTARAIVADMTQAARSIGDRALEDRVAALAEQAQATIARLENDPRDLRRARRFLSVYLVGARDATVKFAQAWSDGRDEAARARYLELLGDLETHFAQHRAELTENARTELDVEIEVLRDRLKMEGV